MLINLLSAIALLVTLLVTASIAIGLAFWAILGYESYRLVSHVLAAPHLVDGFKVSNLCH